MAHQTKDSTDQKPTNAEEEGRRTAAARLFDIRRVIGGLFVVYGLIVTATGLFDSSAELDRAQGVRINLWAGLAMLAFGLAFLLWQWLRPAAAEEPPGEADEQPRGGAGEQPSDSADN